MNVEFLKKNAKVFLLGGTLALMGLIMGIDVCSKSPQSSDSQPIVRKDSRKTKPQQPDTTKPHQPKPIIPLGAYELISGKVAEGKLVEGKLTEVNLIEGEIPLTWVDASYSSIIKSQAPGTKVAFSDNSVIELDGVLAVGKSARHCGIIQGSATVKVAPGETPFKLVNRVGVVNGIQDACFRVEIEELPLKNAQDNQVGDNSAEMKLEVITGEVNVLREGFKQVQTVSAGEERMFMLGEVRRYGEIRALGFGMSEKKGKIGERLKQAGAMTSAMSCLTEFVYGMKFEVVFQGGQYSLSKATFEIKGDVQAEEMKYHPFNEDVMLCMAKGKYPRENSVSRRNAKNIESEGVALVEAHKNLPMAFLSARNNAITAIIQKAAEEVYGIPNVQKVSGTFYPISFEITQQDNKIIAKVSGEVVLD